ncbi:MAG: hypothetical protein NTX50_27335 [Candidatus Sumerlaeota bacterium]|nr:hypothetical protein [Candidatus Sumerlaeota bacterium]
MEDPREPNAGAPQNGTPVVSSGEAPYEIASAVLGSDATSACVLALRGIPEDRDGSNGSSGSYGNNEKRDWGLDSEKGLLQAPLGELVRRALAGITQRNYWYLISAALMLLGAWQMMPPQSAAGKEIDFGRPLRALLALQGYEALVIVTAVVIARRLKALDDAFMLLLTEMALLLDPTFFSNRFSVISFDGRAYIGASGLMVNACCFLAAPIKLWIFLKGTRLQIRAGAWDAFLFTAAFVYLGEFPLLKDPALPGFSQDGFYYLVAWAPAAFALLLPAVKGIFAAQNRSEEYMTRSQGACLDRAMLIVPLGAIVLHLIESLNLNRLFFHAAYLGPMAVAAAVFVMRNFPRMETRKRLRIIDALLALTALASMGFANPQREIRPGKLAEIPAFLEAGLPLIFTALAGVILYFWFWKRWRYRAALWRIGIIGAVAAGCFLWRFDFTKATAHDSVRLGGRILSGMMIAFIWVCDGIASFFTWLSHAIEWFAGAISWHCIRTGGAIKRMFIEASKHPIMIAAVAWALAGIAAWRWRNLLTWLAFGGGTIIGIFWMLPHDSLRYMPEAAQALILLVLLLNYKLKLTGKNAGYALALAIACACLYRYVATPMAWSAGATLAECAVFVAVGLIRRRPGFFLAGGTAGIGFAARTMILFSWHNLPGFIPMSAALVLFAVGVIVTFNKAMILGGLGVGPARFVDKGLQGQQGPQGHQ